MYSKIAVPRQLSSHRNISGANHGKYRRMTARRYPLQSIHYLYPSSYFVYPAQSVLLLRANRFDSQNWVRHTSELCPELYLVTFLPQKNSWKVELDHE